MEAGTGERRPLLVLTRRRRRKRTEPRTRSLIVASVLVGTAALVAVVGWSTRRDLVDDLATGLESLTSCGSCKTLLVPLKAIAHLGDASFLSTLVTVCVGLGIQDPVVCKGALGAQAPILAHSLRGMSIGGPTGTLFCAKTFGLCEYPKVRDWGEALPIRNVSRTPARPARQAGKKKPIRVAHLSDLHIDREYMVSPRPEAPGGVS